MDTIPAGIDWDAELNRIVEGDDLIRVQSHWPMVEHADTKLASEIYTAVYTVLNHFKGKLSNSHTFHHITLILTAHFNFQCYAAKRLVVLSVSTNSVSGNCKFLVGRPLGLPLTVKIQMVKEKLEFGVFAGDTFLTPILPPDCETKYTLERS